jgi:hypothetical protein
MVIPAGDLDIFFGEYGNDGYVSGVDPPVTDLSFPDEIPNVCRGFE